MDMDQTSIQFAPLTIAVDSIAEPVAGTSTDCASPTSPANCSMASIAAGAAPSTPVVKSWRGSEKEKEDEKVSAHVVGAHCPKTVLSLGKPLSVAVLFSQTGGNPCGNHDSFRKGAQG